MTRDEARALIAEAICAQGFRALNGKTATWEAHAEGFLLAADAVLDALFAGGDEEHRVMDNAGAALPFRDGLGVARDAAARWDRVFRAFAPHRVQSRRTLTVVGEWEDENDG